MDAIYPFKEKLKAKLKELKMSYLELGSEIDRSERWVNKIESFEDLSFEYIIKISEVLKFDFVSDYYRWIKRNAPGKLDILQEPMESYASANDITITVTMRGNVNKAGDTLQKIKATAESEGFKID